MTAATLLQLVLICLQLGSAPGFLSGYRERDTETGRLYSRGWTTRDVQDVAARLPRVLRDIELKLQRKLGTSFTTVLAPDRAELRRIVKKVTGRALPGEYPLGVAIPPLRLLVLREGLIPGSSSFNVTLAHEVAHLVIHRDTAVRVPKWFDEGTAMWLSGTNLTPRDEGYLSFLARIGALYPLSRLEYSFPPGDETTSTAYRQSFLLVSFLVERHGEGVLARFLDRLEAGEKGLHVLETIAGLPLEDLEGKFARWVQARQSLVTALSSVLTIWTAIASLAVLAIAVQVWRRRRRWKALEAEEAQDPLDPEHPTPLPAPPDPG